jgi:hypothetical protein
LTAHRVAAQDVDGEDEIDFSAIAVPELEMFGTASLTKYWGNIVLTAKRKGKVSDYHGQCAALLGRVWSAGS